MTVEAHKENSSFIETPNEKGLRCTSNYDDTIAEIEALLGEKIWSPQSIEDLGVDITSVTNSSAMRPSEAEDPDETEYSSSFGDTASGSENLSCASDAEVDSEFCRNGLASIYNGYGSTFLMRKRKLTSHWRKFIQPLMWRCKWAELRIRELDAQSVKYSQEIAANEQRYMVELEQFASESCSKSIPFVGHGLKRKPLPRRKRRQVEKITDMVSYISHHHLFSYLENRKSDQDGTSTNDDMGHIDFCSRNDELGFNDDLFKYGENSLEHILFKIENIQLRVQRLRDQLDMVMLANGVQFSSWDNLSLLVPYDAQTSSVHSPGPAFSAGNGDTMSLSVMYTPSQHFSGFDIEDLVLPENVASSYVEAVQIPDIIESTVGLLSGADITAHQPHIVESGENNLDDVLLQNQGAQYDHSFDNIIDQSTEEPHSAEKDDQVGSGHPPVTGPAPECVAEIAMPSEKPTPKPCLVTEIHIPTNKRKRGERKAAPCGWNLKRSSEPDSQ
ncbi:hypothetical protein Ancab_008349 [Ancistrocladus abbreviatus]